MKIDNIRYGFACNSSSTHSVVVYPGLKSRPTDHLIEVGQFGWETFVAASEQAKQSYLKTIIRGRLHSFGTETARRIAESYFPGDIPADYIDHQSVPLIPRTFNSKEPCYEFFQDMVAYIMRDEVVIHGGNDNNSEDEVVIHWGNDNSEEDTPPESNASWYNLLPKDAREDEWVCRKEGDWWILFNTSTGAKITLSFKDNPAPRLKAEIPELVDLKITNYCPYACTYCVEPSTLVLCADLSWKPISTFKPNDEILAFDETPERGTKDRRIQRAVVEKICETYKPAVLVMTDYGSIVCSLDHQWLMSHTHRWLKTKDLKLGHRIMFSTAPWENQAETPSYKRGYLSGVSCGDGTSHWEKESDRKQVYWSLRMADEVAIRRAYQYVTDFGITIPEVSDYMINGGTKMFRLEARSKAALQQLCGIVALDKDTDNADYRRGWLAGFFDAEGSYSGVIRFSQKTTDLFLDIVEQWLKGFGFDCVKEQGHEVRLRGGRWENLRFIALTRPAISRKFEPLFQGGVKHKSATVIKLEMLPEQKLVDIQTSTRTFIANGLASHNCYMGSTTKGGHAEDIYGWYYALLNMGVFELAIGGGEPTMHPDFEKLLRSVNGDTRVNFTTRNLDWICFHADLIREKCGGFAFSVDDFHKAKDILKQLEKYDLLEKCSLQYVMGSAEDWHFESLVKLGRERGIRLTLLGYKTTGRGSKAKRRLPQTPGQDGDGWIHFIKKNGGQVAIDTALAARVKNNTFKEEMIRRFEGTHSMYIDAVAEVAGVSSYTEHDLLPVKRFGNSIEEVFRGLQDGVSMSLGDILERDL